MKCAAVLYETLSQKQRRLKTGTEVGSAMRRRWLCAAMLLALSLGGPAAAANAMARAIFRDPALQAPPAIGEIAPGVVRAQFMGATTLLFDDGEAQILIDGFFTRPSWLAVLTATMRPDRDVMQNALRQAGATRVGAVLVAHAHHDHALDAPDVALLAQAMRAPGALEPVRLRGSSSVRQIAIGRDFPVEDRFTPLSDGQVFGVGKFKVTAISTPHSPSPLSSRPITRKVRRGAPFWRYGNSDNFSFLIQHGDLKILVYPSAAAPLRALPEGHADVVFLGVGSLGKQDSAFADAYWAKVVGATQAGTVIPIHWDDFGRALDKPLKPLRFPFDDADAGLDAVARRARDHHVLLRLMTPFVAVDLRATAPGAPQW